MNFKGIFPEPTRAVLCHIISLVGDVLSLRRRQNLACLLLKGVILFSQSVHLVPNVDNIARIDDKKIVLILS